MRISKLACFLVILLLATLAAEAAAPVDIEVRTLKKSGKGWSVEMKYPQMTGRAPRQWVRQFNRHIVRYVNQTVAAFQKEVQEAGGPGSGETDWQIWQETEVPLRTDAYVSVVMKGGQYTGGAHPNPFVETVLYDVARARVLRLGDLFRKDSGWLQKLSDIAVAQLRKKLTVVEPGWIENGAAPTAQNYQFFYLSGQRLVILFPPYQVAPYAEGYIEVSIPFQRLRGIAVKNGPIR